jgi:hypothetical protein
MSNSLPTGVVVDINIEKVEKDAAKLQKEIDDEVKGQRVNPILSKTPVVESKQVPDVVVASKQDIATLATTPQVIKKIKKEKMSKTKLFMYGAAVSSLLAVIGTLAVASTPAAAVVAPEVSASVLTSVGYSVSDLLTMGSVLPVGAVTRKLLHGAQWVLNQRNLPDKVRDKVKKGVEIYTESDQQVSSEVEEMKKLIESLRSSSKERENANRELSAYNKVLEEKLRDVMVEAAGLAKDMEKHTDSPDLLETCRVQLGVLKSNSEQCLAQIETIRESESRNNEVIESFQRKLSQRDAEFRALQARLSTDDAVVEKLKRCNKTLEERNKTISELMETDIGKALAKKETEYLRMQEARQTKLDLELYRKYGTVPEWDLKDSPNAYSIARAKIQELIDLIKAGDDSEDVAIQLEWFIQREKQTDEYQRIQIELAEAERVKNKIFELAAVPVQLSFFSYLGPYKTSDVGMVDEQLEHAVNQYVESVMTNDAAKTLDPEHVYGLMWSAILGKEARPPSVVPDMPKTLSRDGQPQKPTMPSVAPRPDMSKMLAQIGKPRKPVITEDEIKTERLKTPEEVAIDEKKRASIMSELATRLPKKIEGGAPPPFLAAIQERKKPTDVRRVQRPQTIRKAPEVKSATELTNYPRLSNDAFNELVRQRVKKYMDSSPEKRIAAANNFASRVNKSIVKLMSRMYAYKRQRDILNLKRERGEDVSDLKSSVERKEGAIFGITFVKQSGAYNTLDWVEMQTMIYLLPLTFEKEPTPAMKDSLVYIRDSLIPGMKKELQNMNKVARHSVYTNEAFPPIGPFWDIGDPPLERGEKHGEDKPDRTGGDETKRVDKPLQSERKSMMLEEIKRKGKM